MKRSKLLSIILCIGLILSISAPAKACDLKTAGNEVRVISESLLEGYEACVISQMAGRAGASTRSGAHGIAFEVLYKDMNNLKNFICILKPKERISLSSSSTDNFADLVVTDANNDVVRLIQCKDVTDPSGVKKVLDSVIEGKYNGAELVGTKEGAALFNKKAADMGVDALMIDSGISNETTKKIAEKALGAPIKSILEKISASALTGGVFGGAISLIESILNEDDEAMTLSKTTIGTMNGSISAIAGTGMGELVTTGMILIGLKGTLLVVGAFAACVITGTVIYIGLEKFEEWLDIKEKVADGYDAGMTAFADFIVYTQDEIESIDTEKICNRSENAIKEIKNCAMEYWGSVICNISSKIKKNK